MKTQSVTIEERIEQTKRSIKIIRADLKVLNADKERRLIKGDSTSQINSEIANAQRKISEKTLLAEALQRKLKEQKALEKQQQHEARRKELEAEASQLQVELVKTVLDFEEQWHATEETVNTMKKLNAKVRQIREEAGRIGATVFSNIPDLNAAIGFFDDIHTPPIEAYFRRNRKHLKKNEQAENVVR